MRIGITGGAGFIGGHLAEAFVKAGHDVRAIDTLTEYYDPGIKRRTIDTCRDAALASGGSYAFYNREIRDTAALADACTGADVCFHQAAQAGVRGSVNDPQHYEDVNVAGTLSVLEVARREDIDRVVYASSSSVYGTGQSVPYVENGATKPVSPYGVSKLAGERYVCTYDRLYDISGVATRYFTVYGPRMRPNMAISNFISRALAGDPPVIYGDGDQTRDFTFVADVVAANRTLLHSDAADGEALNIGSGQRITIRELADVVRSAVPADVGLTFDDRHAADAEHTLADISKARDLLEYEPSVDIREGVGRMVEWYRQSERVDTPEVVQ